MTDDRTRTSLTEEQAWEALRQVGDPEIPVVSLVEMGIIRNVEKEIPNEAGRFISSAGRFRSFRRCLLQHAYSTDRKVPGLKKMVVSKFTRTLMGGGYYLMNEMYLENTSSLKAGMQSEEMVNAGENLNTFASDLVTLMFAEESV